VRAVWIINGIGQILFHTFGTDALVAVLTANFLSNGLCIRLNTDRTWINNSIFGGHFSVELCVPFTSLP